MLSKRSIIIGLLLVVPVLVYGALGAYALWETGLFRWTWWIIPGCWALTFVIARFWPKKRYSIDEPDLPLHWTPQDEAAMEIVKRFQLQVDELQPEQLTDLNFYVDQSQALAKEVAQHYHPDSADLYSSLTVLEVLAAIRLAVEDVEIWFHENVPGSHLITIKQWKLLGHAPKWVKRVSDASWLASVLWNPLNVARYLTSKATFDPIANDLKSEFLAAAYMRFVRQVGFYLVEMNSGRLRRGADRYRETFGSDASEVGGPHEKSDKKRPVVSESTVVAVVGQVKAGKSSIVNALIGQREATTDVLPATKMVSRHTLQIPESTETLTLLDTPGYADSGASKSEMKELQTAVDEADILLLVTDAHSPAKAADVQLIKDLQTRQEKHPELKPAPMLLCLTHIDLLSPMMEWSPPYHWQQPESPKEQSIHDAVRANQELFGERIQQIVPVCSDVDRGREYNIDQGLIPALAESLQAGKAVALLKAYEQSLDNDRISTVFRQLQSSGKSLLKMWIDERLKEK